MKNSAVSARAFLEASFRPERVGDRGLLTAYFAPEYEARAVREGPYTAPVRTKPSTGCPMFMPEVSERVCRTTIT